MTNDQNNLAVQIHCRDDELDVDFDKFRELTYQICTQFTIGRATISIAIVDDDAISKVNSEFLNRDTRTDVISFDLSDEGSEHRVFELVVNADKAARESAKRKHSIEAELALYITHGMLHNLGLGDEDSARADEMHTAEDKILQQAGFGTVYNSLGVKSDD